MQALKAVWTVPALILTACVSECGTHSQGPHLGDPSLVRKDGAEVCAKVCAFCHEAKVGPTIRGRGLAPAYITFIVRHGNRAMPSFRAAEIDDESLAPVSNAAATKGGLTPWILLDATHERSIGGGARWHWGHLPDVCGGTGTEPPSGVCSSWETTT
ncbi:MAG: cytochrome c [Nitrospira sp.]|nr:cytochrome c [Nitrospira sp.]